MATTVLNNKPPIVGEFKEIGTPGLEAWSGYIQQAYHADLQWPTVYPLFNRIYRSDPEIGGIVRPAYTTFVRRCSLTIEPPDNASDDDKAAIDYAWEMFDEIEGGIDQFVETTLKTAFFGWSWFEVVLGLRNGRNYDDWKSKYNDGLPAIRKLAYRDPSSFCKWNLDEYSGKLYGMEQYDPPNEPKTIPIERSLHLTFGDPTSPEGISPLEAVWRLERIKYGYETIFGIGAEHTAGHLKVTSDKSLGDADAIAIDKAARAILAAQPGNYAAFPPGVDGTIIDSPFSAAAVLLEAIRYYGLLKLQVYNMQHVAIASTAGTGSYSAGDASSTMAILSFNGMMEGFFKQINDQLGKRIFDHPLVRQRFPGMTGRPTIGITPIEKSIPLNELSQFASQLYPIMPLGDDDFIAIRRKSEFLPEALPEIEDVPPMPETAVTEDDTTQPEQDMQDEPEQPDMTPEEVANIDGEMSIDAWWKLRQEIYSNRNLPHDLLIDMLDHAETVADLARVEEEIAKYE